MASTRATWTGAITLAGFPIHVAAFGFAKKQPVPSFKTLDPVHLQPIHTQMLDVEGNPVEREEAQRGVELGKGTVVALTEEQIAQVKSAEKSETIEPERFARRETVPLHVATARYALVPDPKVAGSERPASILWNGLRASGRVLIAEWTKKEGTRTTIIAVEATDDGLMLHELPYKTDLYHPPSWRPEVDSKAEATFVGFVMKNANSDDFDLGDYEDGYMQRREAMIEAAVEGRQVEAPKPAAQQASAPDLMAALQASVGQVEAKPKRTAKAAPRKKVAA